MLFRAEVPCVEARGEAMVVYTDGRRTHARKLGKRRQPR
jgi:hypothetical protein